MNDKEDLKTKGEFMASINFYEAPDDLMWARYRHRDGNEQARTTRGATGEAYALERNTKMGCRNPPTPCPRRPPESWSPIPC